eukprot:scaffold1790_cov130-Isochrysis_galbana.AAC.6
MPRHVDSRARARASLPTRCTPHRLGRQAIFPFCSAWAWDGGGGGGTIGGGGLPSPPYAHSKPYTLPRHPADAPSCGTRARPAPASSTERGGRRSRD